MVSEEIQRTLLNVEPVTALRVLPYRDDLGLDPFAAARGRYARFVKPVIDRLAAAVLLVLAAPLIAVVAVMVARGIGQPVIFWQLRVGQNGRLFTVYKFRTMAADRRRRDVPIDGDRRVCHKSDDDPRMNEVGRRLRRWSLDELPQLWNVLRGDMSLVGPRPELPSIVSHFAEWQHGRHLVKPGLTGFWQVYARGDGRLMHERTDLDIAYVGRIGALTDLRILVLTIPAITGMKRGY